MNLVARYFLFVGGALLALLFAFDAFAPKASANNTAQTTASVDKSTLRIRSNQKWPDKIVFDTSQATIVPKAAPAPQVALAGPEPTPEISAKARVRETFAQFTPALKVEAAKKGEARPQVQAQAQPVQTAAR